MPYDPVVEAASLGALSAFRLVDARTAGAVSADIVPHAIRAPIETWDDAARASETDFGNVAFWEGAIGALGVDGDTPSIVFDDGRMTDAARVWFILQYFGAKAFILNGGRPAIEGRALRGSVQTPSDPSAFQARPGSGLVGLVDRATLSTGARTCGATGVADISPARAGCPTRASWRAPA